MMIKARFLLVQWCQALNSNCGALWSHRDLQPVSGRAPRVAAPLQSGGGLRKEELPSAVHGKAEAAAGEQQWCQERGQAAQQQRGRGRIPAQQGLGGEHAQVGAVKG